MLSYCAKSKIRYARISRTPRIQDESCIAMYCSRDILSAVIWPFYSPRRTTLANKAETEARSWNPENAGRRTPLPCKDERCLGTKRRLHLTRKREISSINALARFSRPVGRPKNGIKHRDASFTRNAAAVIDQRIAISTHCGDISK